MRRCPVCCSESASIVTLPFPLFRHLDFETVADHGELHCCQSCGAMSTASPGRVASVLDEFIARTCYLECRPTQHRIRVPGRDVAVTRSSLQAEFLADRTDLHSRREEPLSVLDIGCFDGQFLQEFGRLFPNAELCGFDINPHVDTLFPHDDRMRLVTTSLSDIDTRFDLIVLSHSLMYFRNLPELYRNVQRLLSADGVAFIVTPDITANPFYLLQGDQYSVWNADSLVSVAEYIGFVAETIRQPHFPHEAAALLRHADQDTSTELRFEPAVAARSAVATLRTMAGRLAELPAGRPLYVLGTTSNAAWTHCVLADREVTFVDEIEQKQGSGFRGRPVVGPGETDRDGIMVLPYPGRGDALAERFARDFGIECVTI